MGRTVPSFRLALAEEESEWRVYRQHLNRAVRKDLDDMFAIPRLYLSACSGATKLVRLNPIFVSIALHHFLQLKEITRARQIEEVRVVCR